MANKLIVGIHGLANKPEEGILTDWWKKSIAEGLKETLDIQGGYDFRMVYWRNLLYKHPLHDDKDFYFDALFNEEPYGRAAPGSLKKHRDSILDEARRVASNVLGNGVDRVKQWFGFDGLVGDRILGKLLRDLAFYYEDDRKIRGSDGNLDSVKTVLRKTLSDVILGERDKDLMIVAHSMGSIIAYDALRDLGQTDPGLQIKRFVTIGSPLGLPYVKGKIIKERSYDKEP